MADKPRLGYWSLRGRAQPIRLLLSYTKTDFEDFQYSGPEKWFGPSDKNGLGLDFPNLPYLIHGDVKLTETNAILKYVAKKYGEKDLTGKNIEDQGKVDMLLSVFEDILSPTLALFYSPNWESESTRLFDGKIKEKLTYLENFIGEKEYILGYLTILDFRLAEGVHYLNKLYGKNFEAGFDNIRKIQKTVESLPEVKSYYDRENAVKEPFLTSYTQLKF